MAQHDRRPHVLGVEGAFHRHRVGRVTCDEGGDTVMDHAKACRQGIASRGCQGAALDQARMQPGSALHDAKPEDVMGPYFPTTVYCSKEAFEATGWAGCFNG